MLNEKFQRLILVERDYREFMQHFLRLRPNIPKKYSLWTNDVKKI